MYNICVVHVRFGTDVNPLCNVHGCVYVCLCVHMYVCMYEALYGNKLTQAVLN